MGGRGTRTCPRRPLAPLLSAPTFCIGNAFLLIVILDPDSPKSRGKGPSATLSPGFRILRRINPQVQRAKMTPAVLGLWAPTKCAFSGSEDAQELALCERERRPAAGIGGRREAGAEPGDVCNLQEPRRCGSETGLRPLLQSLCTVA